MSLGREVAWDGSLAFRLSDTRSRPIARRKRRAKINAPAMTEAELMAVEGHINAWRFKPGASLPYARNACYRLIADGAVLYVGMAESLSGRWASSDKLMQMHVLGAAGNRVELEYVETGSTDNAFALEREWLKLIAPDANRQMQGNRKARWCHKIFMHKHEQLAKTEREAHKLRDITQGVADRRENRYIPPVHHLPEIDLTPTPQAVAAAKAEVERRRAAIANPTTSVGWHIQGEQAMPKEQGGQAALKENRGVPGWVGIPLLFGLLAVFKALAMYSS